MDIEGILFGAYETQHFGFHPRAFIDEVYNTFFENIFEALNEMKKYLTAEYCNVITTETINTRTDALFYKLIKQLDKAIDKLEVYLHDNVFAIPPHVALPEDEVHVTHSCTKEEEAKLDEEIDELKQKIIQERIRKTFIKSKKSEQKLVMDKLLSFKKQLKQLHSTIFQTRLAKDSIQITLENCLNLCNKMKDNSKNLNTSMDLD